METEETKEQQIHRLQTNIEEQQQQFAKKEAEYQNAIENYRKISKTVRRNFQGMVQLLIETVSLDNRFLGSHLKRVADMAWAFADYLDLAKETAYLLYYSSLLHDIGLVGEDNALIENSPAHFDQQQGDQYRLHPWRGYHIISTIYNLKRTSLNVKSHHEHWDGTGFPDGLAHNAIPYGARVLAVLNDYDSLIFRGARTSRTAHEEIIAQAGTYYDPEIIEAFQPFIESWIQKEEGKQYLLYPEDLEPGMFLVEDIILRNGVLLVPEKTVLNKDTVRKIQSFSSSLGPRRKIKVFY
jgi:response regulator RpfG family c-di-GMP phosphodiesterase